MMNILTIRLKLEVSTYCSLCDLALLLQIQVEPFRISYFAFGFLIESRPLCRAKKLSRPVAKWSTICAGTTKKMLKNRGFLLIPA